MPLESLLSVPSLLELFSELGEGIFSTDADGRILSINGWGAQLLGYPTPQELLQSPQGSQSFRDAIPWAALQGEGVPFPYRSRFTVQTPGRAVTIEAALVRSKNTSNLQFFGGFREVSATDTEVRHLTERNKELEAVRNLAVDATRFEDQAALLDSMLRVCMQVIGAHGGAIYLYDQAHKRLVMAASANLPPSIETAVREFKLGQGFTGKVAVTRIPVFLDDLSNHPAQESEIVRQANIRNFASFPLQVNERLLGVMNLHTMDDQMITGSDFGLLGVLSAQISLSLDHVRRMEELRERNAELEKFNRLSVDRELRMIELKKRIRELEAELKLKS